MNNADNDCTMSRELAATRCPVFIEGRVIESEEAPRTARNNEAFTQVLVEGRSTSYNVFTCKMLFGVGTSRPAVANLIATVARLVAGR